MTLAKSKYWQLDRLADLQIWRKTDAIISLSDQLKMVEENMAFEVWGSSWVSHLCSIQSVLHRQACTISCRWLPFFLISLHRISVKYILYIYILMIWQWYIILPSGSIPIPTWTPTQSGLFAKLKRPQHGADVPSIETKGPCREKVKRKRQRLGSEKKPES